MTGALGAAPELKIETLGRFSVRRADQPLPDGAWGRAKARQLFQYLITYRRRLVMKERLVADLWPDLDPKRADRDFKVALNALNSALQPDRPARSPSVYILRQGTSYGLDPQAPIQLDVTDFEAGLAAGSRLERQEPSQAIVTYRQALELYRGEYLPEALYRDWASAERERLATLFLTGATRLAALLMAQGEAMETMIWSQRVLAQDPYWEEAYRLLMRAHMANGNRPLAMRMYETCRQVLAEDLGLEPLAETRRLYEEIRSGQAG